MSRRDLATTRTRLNQEQVERLRHVAAFGPCKEMPVDAGLRALGWVESYDLPDTIDTVDGRLIFDRSGSLHSWLAPKEPTR